MKHIVTHCMMYSFNVHLESIGGEKVVTQSMFGRLRACETPLSKMLGPFPLQVASGNGSD